MLFGNRLLDRLPAPSREALTRLLVRVSLSSGAKLVSMGDKVETAHFPIDAQLANVIPLRNGGSSEVSAIGCEGVTGLAPVLADRPCGWDVVVRQPGSAWAVRGKTLMQAAKADETLFDHLLVLAGFYQMQSSVTAACNSHHPVSARLARVILTADDLASDGRLAFTQDELARLLGSARSTVNEEASFYRDQGAIRYSRGQIEVINRKPLERYACECYTLLHEAAVRDGLLST